MAKTSTALTSMTGFARSTGQWRDVTWTWEIKSVNGKALDVRIRVPSGYEALEIPARALALQKLKRGNVQVGLTMQVASSTTTLRVNEAVLEEILRMAETLRDRLGSAPIQAENLLGLRGVLDQGETNLSEEDSVARDLVMLKSFEVAVKHLVEARNAEGARLTVVIEDQLRRIASLVQAARDNPSRSVEAVRARLAEQVNRIVEQSDTFDPQRLHQEAIILATRADIQEELDRLDAHVAAATELMKAGEPVGRKFDFLAQEFNREANTLCSKSADVALTAIGLDLKTVIDQLREQIQNIE
jgi:uncharacterized protein (TIGR00255 family)